MLLSKSVIVKWNPKIKKHYESKGYVYTKMGDEFEVKVEDLTNGSKVKVEVKCDCENCKNPYLKPMEYRTYIKYLKENGKYYCSNCMIILFTVKQATLTKLSKSKSFGQYLLDTYGENAIKDYWSSKNTVNPFEISIKSSKKIWIKCRIKNYHYDYRITCDSFAQGNRCPYCSGKKVHPLDSLGKLLEDKRLLHLWSDKNEKSSYEYTQKSNKEVWWKCQKGVHEDYNRSINSSNNYDFRCPSCQFSKGEKRIEEYLINNKIEYIPQHGYEGLVGVNGGNLSYDFYLLQYNILIEYQGEFHDGTAYQQTKEEFEIQKEHDRRKKEYAEDHKINLLPIWYWDFDNIEEILDRGLQV